MVFSHDSLILLRHALLIRPHVHALRLYGDGFARCFANVTEIPVCAMLNIPARARARVLSALRASSRGKSRRLHNRIRAVVWLIFIGDGRQGSRFITLAPRSNVRHLADGRWKEANVIQSERRLKSADNASSDHRKCKDHLLSIAYSVMFIE